MATSPAFMCFSCCWKDVRLKRCPGIFLRCAMNVSVVVERMYDWSGLWWIQSPSCPTVSVVVERMYDWSNEERKMNKQIENRFSCCWKDVRLKRPQRHTAPAKEMFQLLLKGCTIEATSDGLLQVSVSFQLLLKGCTIEAVQSEWSKFNLVSVVVERMYDWSKIISTQKRLAKSFSCCWKDVRLKQTADSFQVRGEGFQLLLKGCTIEAPKPTDWKQMIFDSWFLICFSKMVDLHKKCHYFRKFGEIWVIAWLFLIVIVTSSYILSTTKSP